MTYQSGPTLEPVSIDLAKAHLRLVSDEDNTYIEHLITASRLSAEKYIGVPIGAQVWLDDEDEEVTVGIDPVPADITAAMLLTIGHLYTNREAVIFGKINVVELTMGVKHLLHPYKVY